GGVSSIQSYFRDKLIDWKKESMKSCDYKCVVTNDVFDDIHHLYSFHSILENTLKILEINIRDSISEYNSKELKIIEDKLIEEHSKYPLGVCLRKDIHQLFHNLYGNTNNTPEQFYEFKEDYIGLSVK